MRNILVLFSAIGYFIGATTIAVGQGSTVTINQKSAESGSTGNGSSDNSADSQNGCPKNTVAVPSYISVQGKNELEKINCIPKEQTAGFNTVKIGNIVAAGSSNSVSSNTGGATTNTESNMDPRGIASAAKPLTASTILGSATKPSDSGGCTTGNVPTAAYKNGSFEKWICVPNEQVWAGLNREGGEYSFLPKFIPIKPPPPPKPSENVQVNQNINPYSFEGGGGGYEGAAPSSDSADTGPGGDGACGTGADGGTGGNGGAGAGGGDSGSM